MRIVFNIEYNDGSAAETAVASVADQVAYEREFSQSITHALAEPVRLADLCWLAWHGIQRTTPGTPDFTQWVERVEDIKFGDSTIVPLEETTQPTG